jgi:hypothetical protein
MQEFHDFERDSENYKEELIFGPRKARDAKLERDIFKKESEPE